MEIFGATGIEFVKNNYLCDMRRIKLTKTEKIVLRMIAVGQSKCPAEYPLHDFNSAVEMGSHHHHWHCLGDSYRSRAIRRLRLLLFQPTIRDYS